MSKVNSLLSQRFKKATNALSKMSTLVERSSFSGVFKVSQLTASEEESLKELLLSYQEEASDIEEDLLSLSALTAEVKAINNQAILLHGERIKRAQEILKNYKEGAFSTWLMAAYGNRQTPYNFLQYYNLHFSLQEELQHKLDHMPRQAVYSLASREGDLDKKVQIIMRYKQESKEALLKLIRETFPLSTKDHRAQNLASVGIKTLTKLHTLLHTSSFSPNKREKQELLYQLSALKTLIQNR